MQKSKIVHITESRISILFYWLTHSVQHPAPHNYITFCGQRIKTPRPYDRLLKSHDHCFISKKGHVATKTVYELLVNKTQLRCLSCKWWNILPMFSNGIYFTIIFAMFCDNKGRNSLRPRDHFGVSLTLFSPMIMMGENGYAASKIRSCGLQNMVVRPPKSSRAVLCVSALATFLHTSIGQSLLI